MSSARRHATVIFADLTGFTSMSEKLDPEELRDVINACFHAMEAAVTAHGGHVDKYIGDCVMATFGAPSALEQPGRAGINASLEMRSRIEVLARERHIPPIEIHIGVNSGLVLAGDVGGEHKRDFTVMGDAVNVASRLKDAAARGAVWVGRETYLETRHDFEFKALPAIKAKGKEQPVEAWEVLSREPQRHRARPVGVGRMIGSELVGREQELAALVALVDRVRDGQGGAVAVVGEAGIGKSRLLAEMQAAGRDRGVAFLEARSLALGENLRFHPFVDLLRQWCEIADDTADDGARDKLAARIASVLPDGGADAMPLCATVLGLQVAGPDAERLAGMDGDALERMIEKATRDVLRGIARAQPTVVVFEDLHWADQSSVKLLEAVIRVVTEVPLLLVLAARPDYARTSQHVIDLARREAGASWQELRLGRLDPKQAEALVRNLLRVDDLPYEVRAAITRRAEGNPFFVEEVVRSLIDAGAIEAVGDRFRVTAAIEHVVIPGTIQAVIMARVDALPAEARAVIELAAVIGRRFPRALLAALTSLEEQALDWQLRYLRHRQILEEFPSGTDREYAFAHALLQETIYESILQKTRRELHDRVAMQIESLFAERLDEFFPMLAFHYTRAENLPKAEDYLFKAGEDAARTAASNEALHFFEEALRVYTLRHGEAGDPQRRATLERNIGRAHLTKGNLPDSVAHFDRALALLGEPVSPTPVRAGLRVAGDLAVLLLRLYTNRVSGRARPTDAEAFQIRYDRARAQTTSDPKRFVFDTIGSLRRLTTTDPRAIDQACAIYTSGAAVFAWLGISFAVCKRFLRVAETLVRPGNTRDEFGHRSWAFVVHFLEGDWSAAHAIPDALVDEALRVGQFWDVNTYLGLDCERRIHQGDFAGARQTIGRIARLAHDIGYDFARSNELAMAAFLALEERRLDDAKAAVDDYYSERSEEALNVLALGLRAKVELLRGQTASAKTALEAGEALVRRVGQVPGFHRSVLLQSRLLYDLHALEDATARGDAAAVRALTGPARQHAKAVLRIAGSVARERVEGHRYAGRLAWLVGDAKRAIGEWERAIEVGQEMEARPELGRTWVEIGERLDGDPRTVAGLSAEACRTRGHALLAELGIPSDQAPGAPVEVTPMPHSTVA